MTAKTMAAVLAEHQDWTYLIARNAMVCAGRNCGWTKALSEDETSRDAYLAHQAAALSAAGFGLVADAKAGALEELGRPVNVNAEALEAAKKVHDEALPYLTMHTRLAVALEAAAPHLRAEALREAASALMDVREHEARMPGIRFAVGFLAAKRRPAP